MTKTFVYGNFGDGMEFIKLAPLTPVPAVAYSNVLSLDLTTDFTLLTNTLVAGVDTYVVLRAPGGFGFSPDMVCVTDVGVVPVILAAENYILVPINRSAGIYTFHLQSEGVSTAFTVTFQAAVTDDISGFSAALQNFTPIGGVTQTYLVTGASLGEVTSVVIDGSAVAFHCIAGLYIVFDSFIATAKSFDIELYSTSTVLETFALESLYAQTEDALYYHYFYENLTYLIALEDIPSAVIYGEGNVPYFPDYIFDGYMSSLSESQSDFVYFVRDRGGRVVPNTGYIVTAANFSMSGFSDPNGRIAIALDLLPSVFTLTFHSYDLAFLNQVFSKQVI